MEIAIGVLILIVAGWVWRARQYDKFTTLDFDAWLSKYDAASNPLQRSRMAVAFLSQSIHMAWSMGAINSKQRDAVTEILKSQPATTTMIVWLGKALPAVARVVSQADVCNTPARTVGMFMLLAWMSPDDEQENAIRQFLSRR